ncbi:hypothetical protein [Buttiauxella brennerae]|uniref:hypothetical protein n=1 Tax=Buttiauxella brennerae TaxID=82988 RepID=UPI0012EDCCD9|nr:hypothetical protein [Buttiauxella brennerae]
MVDGDYAHRHLERIMYVADSSLLLRDKPEQKELALEVIRNIIEAYFRQEKLSKIDNAYHDSPPPADVT